ncbi:uncharacterized protein LOC113296254 [Papaver somniferum]|uniref:uncharacterized protein LOC113296254 n=1 Tax=Papaver somniferum TaxID=3469 RepID=UPI000E6F7207|nr:uncharacterized protein LOC113296254 [Papaver somniferum]
MATTSLAIQLARKLMNGEPSPSSPIHWVIGFRLRRCEMVFMQVDEVGIYGRKKIRMSRELLKFSKVLRSHQTVFKSKHNLREEALGVISNLISGMLFTDIDISKPEVARICGFKIFAPKMFY